VEEGGNRNCPLHYPSGIFNIPLKKIFSRAFLYKQESKKKNISLRRGRDLNS
jgi:hypothetical protein